MTLVDICCQSPWCSYDRAWRHGFLPFPPVDPVCAQSREGSTGRPIVRTIMPEIRCFPRVCCGEAVRRQGKTRSGDNVAEIAEKHAYFAIDHAFKKY